VSIVKVVGEQASGSSSIAIGILLLIAALGIAILIHELGHLTAGWFLGFQFSRISVGPFALHLEHGRLKLSFLRELTALGYAGMHVDTVVRLRHRFLIYAVAGATANLVTVPIAVLFANHTARKDDRLSAVHLERCLRMSRWLTHTVRDLAAQELRFSQLGFDVTRFSRKSG
jgi:hypothetical protein